MMLQVMVKKLSNNEKIEWWQCVLDELSRPFSNSVYQKKGRRPRPENKKMFQFTSFRVILTRVAIKLL